MVLRKLGRWESHSELHPNLDHTKIAYTLVVSGGKAIAWWLGLYNAQMLPSAWDEFVNMFMKRFLQPPFVRENTKLTLTLSNRKFSSFEDNVHYART